MVAEQLLPAMTARMWGVRMLTFIAEGAHVSELPDAAASALSFDLAFTAES